MPSGEGPNSNLDEVVPGYYHRLDANGNLETGSCCPDTASEHRMMEKLMIDTLVLNAREYKIDGFRFDIMSFHFTYNMQHIQAALQALTTRMTASTARRSISTEKASTSATPPTTRSARTPLRSICTDSASAPSTTAFATAFAEAVRLPMSACRDSQPVSSPIRAISPTESAVSPGSRISCCSTLTGFASASPAICATTPLSNSQAHTVTGAQVDYNGQPTGYTKSPIEAVNYCSVHDNQDLFDAVQLKSSFNDSIAVPARAGR